MALRRSVGAWRGAEKSAVKMFVLIAAVFGVAIIAIMPPFTGGDEESHFIRIYGISEGQGVLRKGEQISMPEDFRKTLGCLQQKKPVKGKMYTYLFDEYGKSRDVTHDCMQERTRSYGRSERLTTSASGYATLAYAPQVAAVNIGKSMNATIATMDYMVRVAVLVSYVVLGAIAIKLTPQRKWAMAAILLMPLPLQQITNPGGDYLIMGMLAIFIAGILRSRTQADPKLRSWLFATVLVAAVLMMIPKGAFPGVCFLPLLLGYGRFRYALVKKTIIWILVFLIGFGSLASASIHITGYPKSNEAPLAEFPAAIVKTAMFEWSNSDFLYGKGPRLGNDAYAGMPAIAITAMNMLFLVYLFVGYPESKRQQARRNDRWLNLVGVCCVAMVVITTYASMYFAATFLHRANGSIGGIQARYFYPAYLLLAAMVYNRPFSASLTTYRRTVVLGSCAILAAHVFMLLVTHHWIAL